MVLVWSDDTNLGFRGCSRAYYTVFQWRIAIHGRNQRGISWLSCLQPIWCIDFAFSINNLPKYAATDIRIPRSQYLGNSIHIGLLLHLLGFLQLNGPWFVGKSYCFIFDNNQFSNWIRIIKIPRPIRLTFLMTRYFIISTKATPAIFSNKAFSLRWFIIWGDGVNR